MSLIAKLMLLFTLIPILEITLLVRLHAVIGSTWPIVIVCCTAVLGTVLVRWQGRAALNKIKEALGAGKIPGDEIIDGMLVLLAGTTLITPGLLTDTTGLLLLFPVIRAPVRKVIKRKLTAWLGSDSSPVGFAGGLGEDPFSGRDPFNSNDPFSTHGSASQDTKDVVDVEPEEVFAESESSNLGKPDAIL